MALGSSSPPERLRSGRGTSFELRIQSRASFASHAGLGTPDIVYWYRRWGGASHKEISQRVRDTACATWNSLIDAVTRKLLLWANSEGEN